MKKIFNWFLKPFNKQSKNQKCGVQISLVDDDDITIELVNFKVPKNNEELANYIKVIYVLFSDEFEEALINTVVSNYEKNPEIAQSIIGNVVVLIEQYNMSDEDDEDPIVDPCNVFNKKDIENKEFEE